MGETEPKNSCWNLQDSGWIQSAYKFKISDSVYVHFEILEWLVNFIDNEILQNDWNLRCTVEEIFHHNFDGQVYGIRFYRRLASTTVASILNRTYHTKIMDVGEKLKYKMVWKPKPTYFLLIDAEITKNQKFLMKEFQRLSVAEFLESNYEFNINWVYIDNIQIYKFSEKLTDHQIEILDELFLKRCRSKLSIYIVKDFTWHKLYGEFIDVDTLAMDICAGEWRHYNLFHDYSIQEIFNMDMANKDYRDPYYNEYLDRYLKILMCKWYPDLLTEKKFQYLLSKKNNLLDHYFINQFRNKISTLCLLDGADKTQYENCGIPLTIPMNNELTLVGNEPHPDVLTTLLPKYGSTTLIFENYTHFTDLLFHELLGCQSQTQVYSYNFTEDFIFVIPTPIVPADLVVFPMERRKISILIERCSKQLAFKMEQFVEYLLKLFENISGQENIELTISFNSCESLKDFSLLGSVSKIFQSISFSSVNCSASQLDDLACSMSNRSKIRFYDCDELNDGNVIQVVSRSAIDVQNLYIEGRNSCTPILYFVLAEHVMNTKGIDYVKGRTLSNFQNLVSNAKFRSNFPSLEFFRNDNLIQIRNASKTILDAYCVFNGIAQDEDRPFHYD